MKRVLPLFLSLFFVLSSQAQVDLSRISPHPRLLLPKGGEKELLMRINQSPQWKQIHQATLGEADRLLKVPVNERKMIGVRLLDVSCENQRRIFILGYAYRMTKNKKYLHRAEEEMLKAASFSDWNPSHFLDVAEMTMALGIGYDWFYKELSDNTRKIVRTAIIEKGLTPLFDPAYNWFVNVTHNWNQVCHAGASFGAIAIAEEAPELATRVLNQSIDKMRLPMQEYAPNGTYPEGLGYWSGGTISNVLFLSGLESAFHSDFGLCSIPGFMQTATFAIQMISSTRSQFNYMDNWEKSVSFTAPFWFYSKLKDPSLLYEQARLLTSDTAQLYLQNRTLPAVLIWGAGASLDNPPAPKETFWIGQGKTPVCVMRSSWEDPNARFLGVKLGCPGANHGHMDVGSFVFEASGIRWAIDLGPEMYHNVESKGVDLWKMDQQSQRWDVFHYQNQSHNTLTFNDKKQLVTGSCDVISQGNTPQLKFVTTDLTPVYANQVKQIQRSFALMNGEYAVIEDQVTCGKFYTRMQWTLATRATPRQISDKVIELSQEGKKCYLKVESESPIRWRFEKIPTIDSYNTPDPKVTLVVFDCELPREVQSHFKVFLMPESQKETDNYPSIL